MSSDYRRVLIPLLLNFIVGSSSIPTLNASLQSVNMRHLLRWDGPWSSCSASRFSVQFQGEYELHKLNRTWVDAHDCQNISENQCDLTMDLAGNSDYSIRIRTDCDGQKSLTQLPEIFNPRDTVLVAPRMTVSVTGELAQVGFSTILPDMTVHLKVWSEEDEQNAFNHVIRSFPYHFSTAAHRKTERMCIKAEAVVEVINKSCSTDTQCFILHERDWVSVKLVVVVSLAVLAAVLIAVFLGCSATHFGPKIKQIIWHKEPLPNVLLKDWPTGPPVLCSDAPVELIEPVVHLLPPAQRRTSV